MSAYTFREFITDSRNKSDMVNFYFL